MRINEIFYSLQGEGVHCGTPAIFVRFSGCNLRCSFCDTSHHDGTEMDVDAILKAISRYPAHTVILTGGEPLLQVTSALTTALQSHGYKIHLETNGTMPLPQRVHIDWITCSPKTVKVNLDKIDELKVLFDGEKDPACFLRIPAGVYSLQPLDTGDVDRNSLITKATIKYIMKHPRWRLSLQTHKMLSIP